MAVAVASCIRALWSGKPSKTEIFAVVVLAGLVLLGATPLLAQSPYFPNFNSTTNLQLNGNASATNTGGVLQLTTSQPGQVGAAWFTVLQPVAEGFSTTFKFQILNPSEPPADGIAFVIQNSGTSALGGAGGGIGYQNISNSLAVEFDTFQNAYDPNANHIAIQSCGTNLNSADHTATYGDSQTPCEIAINSQLPVNLSDGAIHTVRIDYTLTQCDGEICVQNPNIQVTVDGNAVFAGGVSVNLSTLLNLASTTDGGPNDSAFIGLTGATGALDETNDILSWSFTPFTTQTITQPAPANTPTVFNFGSYLYKVTPNQSIDFLTVTEVPTAPGTFNAGPSFPGAQCITYDSTGGQCIEFHVTCNSPSNNACTNVNYDVVTSYDVPAGSPAIVNPGFLKATGQDCTSATTFDSNIITQFIQTRTDPTTKGSSKPTFSCFVAVQNVTYQPADLDIINLAAPKVRPGATLTYVATVIDFGPAAGQGVAINNTIPAGTTYVGSSLCSLTNGCSNTPCSFNGTVASCQVGNLAEFGLEFMVVNVKVTAPAGTVISDTANVTGFNPEPDKVSDRSWTTKTLVSNR